MKLSGGWSIFSPFWAGNQYMKEKDHLLCYDNDGCRISCCRQIAFIKLIFCRTNQSYITLVVTFTLAKTDLRVTWKPKSVPLQIIHFHKLKQHDVSILFPFFTTHYIYRGYRAKAMLHCLRFLFGKTWEKCGIPRTTDVSGAVFNALLLATHCFSSMFYIHRIHDIHRSMRSVFYLHTTSR
jgi:hypothetical protein